MTTAYSTLLGLALPVQGELSGTWGDTVDNGITRYLDIAVAGTVTLTGDGAVTMSLTNGDATATNIVSSLTGAGTVSAQFAIIRVTGTLTVAKVLTAPSSSRTYVVVNAATGSTVTVKASGQTGISVAVGETAFVYFNGTDYVKVAGTTAGTGSVTSVAASVPSVFSIAGSPITTSGTLAITYSGTALPVANGGTGVTTSTGTGNTVLSTSPTLTTPVLGTPTSGTLNNCTVDGTNSVGYLNIPQNSQSAAYTLVLADAGKHIFHPSTDANARTFTIPANSSVAYAIGTAITFINMTSQVVTIAITTDTMYLSSAGTTGSRSLAQYGSATAIKMTSTTWLISGSGLT
jgi:hypothetical protein